MLIDTHAHLDYPDFTGDFHEVLRRANEAGVTRIITIGTSVESSRRAIALAENFPNMYAVIGVHPTTADESGEDVITPIDSGEIYQRAMPRSRLVVIENCGHMPEMEKPTEFAGLIENFLAG